MRASFPGSRGNTRLFVARVDVSEIDARTRTESACEANGFVSGSPGVGASRGERPGRTDISDVDRRGTAATPVAAFSPGQAFRQGCGACADKEIRAVNAAF